MKNLNSLTIIYIKTSFNKSFAWMIRYKKVNIWYNYSLISVENSILYTSSDENNKIFSYSKLVFLIKICI